MLKNDTSPVYTFPHQLYLNTTSSLYKHLMSGILSDSLFRYLVKFHVVENFYKRSLRHSTRNGSENHALVAPLIVRDLPTIRAHVKQQLSFRPLSDIDVRSVFIDESGKDGAYVLEKSMLSNKVFLHGLVANVLRDSSLKTIEALQKKYLPSDYLTHLQDNIIGTKTQNALCAGLRGGKAYLIKQTAVNNSSVGKVCLFDQTGLRAEFYLAQDLDHAHPSSHYFHPLKRIVGYLNESPTVNNDDRTTHVITPQQLGILPSKYLNFGEKIATNFNDLLTQLGV